MFKKYSKYTLISHAEFEIYIWYRLLSDMYIGTSRRRNIAHILCRFCAYYYYYYYTSRAAADDGFFLIFIIIIIFTPFLHLIPPHISLVFLISNFLFHAKRTPKYTVFLRVVHCPRLRRPSRRLLPSSVAVFNIIEFNPDDAPSPSPSSSLPVPLTLLLLQLLCYYYATTTTIRYFI